MATYRATFHAPHGGKQTETFEANSSSEAAQKARKYRASFGSSASQFRITIQKIKG
jgi:hypothetical protein